MAKDLTKQTHYQLFHSELFADVQTSSLFEDSKAFSDATAKRSLADILADYENVKHQQDFALGAFVAANFNLPQPVNANAHSVQSESVEGYIHDLWQHLTRAPDTTKQDSLMPLPNRYIVPGGRFQEIYYWDTYFTALGLEQDEQDSLILDTFKNFQHLIDVNGCIPNGNRDYYHGRSQPPVLAMLFSMLLENKKLNLIADQLFIESGLASLESEYAFWMRDKETLSTEKTTALRVVRMPDGSCLNRYWDDEAGPRPESFKEDIELAHGIEESQQQQFFTHIRAACESGWDFSSRWLQNPQQLTSIRTAEIVPVDLNCLLWNLENTLSANLNARGDAEKAEYYGELATQRKHAIQTWCWNEDTGFYHDFCTGSQTTTEYFSLASAYPLFFKLATPAQANKVAESLEKDFLKPGGLITTLTQSPQQWDSPNGWAPLQWISVIGLENYHFLKLSKRIMRAWLDNIELCFKETGCLMEKYNVETPGKIAEGGEYLVQEGFGWTNGVTRAFYHKLKSHAS